MLEDGSTGHGGTRTTIMALALPVLWKLLPMVANQPKHNFALVTRTYLVLWLEMGPGSGSDDVSPGWRGLGGVSI
jgi:hypothetical protein